MKLGRVVSLVLLCVCVLLTLGVSSVYGASSQYVVENDFADQGKINSNFTLLDNRLILRGQTAELFYNFEDSGDTSQVVDLSNNDITGTVEGNIDYVNSDWDSQVGGSAVYFSGDENIRFPFGDLPIDFTFSFWVKPNIDFGKGYWFDFGKEELKVNNYYEDLDVTVNDMDTDVAVLSGDWIYFTISKENNNYYFYRNGELVHSKHDVALDESFNYSYLGSHHSSYSYSWQGYLDRVYFSDFYMDNSGVEKLYNIQDDLDYSQGFKKENVKWVSKTFNYSNGGMIEGLTVDHNADQSVQTTLYANVNVLEGGEVVENTGWKDMSSTSFWNISNEMFIEGENFEVCFKFTDKTSGLDEPLKVDSFNLDLLDSSTAPTIENVSISNRYVDESVEWANDLANGSNQVSVKISNQEGTSNNDSVSVEWVDNSDQVISTTSAELDQEIDSNTAVYVSEYSPSSLEEYRMGGFDVNVEVVDKEGLKDVEKRKNAFFVDDFNVNSTIEFDENNNEVSVVGSAITEVLGFTPSEVYVDSPSGTYSADINGENFNLVFNSDSDVEEGDIGIRVIANGIDGASYGSYTDSSFSSSSDSSLGGLSLVIFAIIGLPVLIVIVSILGRVLGGKK